MRKYNVNILVFGCGEDDMLAKLDHDKHLNALLERCSEKGIKINEDKIKLRMKEVTYMGHKISADGLRVDPEKVTVIKNMPPPIDKKGTWYGELRTKLCTMLIRRHRETTTTDQDIIRILLGSPGTW